MAVPKKKPTSNVWPHILSGFVNMFGGKMGHDEDTIDEHNKALTNATDETDMPDEGSNNADQTDDTEKTHAALPGGMKVSHPKLKILLARLGGGPAAEEDEEGIPGKTKMSLGSYRS